MKLIRSLGKWKIAKDGKFIAEFDSLEEAKAFMEPKVIKPVPVKVPEDVELGEPYEEINERLEENS